MDPIRFVIEALKGVQGYKRFKARVAVDFLNHYHSVNYLEYDADTECEGDRDEDGGY